MRLLSAGGPISPYGLMGVLRRYALRVVDRNVKKWRF